MQYKIVNRKKLVAVKTADLVLSPFLRAWQKISGQKNLPLFPQDFPNIKKILVLRTAYIGDVVMTLPVLAPLKSAFPNAELVFLTSHGAASVLKEHPAVDRVIEYDASWFYRQPKLIALDKKREIIKQLRRERFDLVIDFRGDIRDIYFLAYRSKAKHRISYGSGGGAYWLTQVIPLREIKHRVQFHLDILRELKIPIFDEIPKIYLTVAEKQTALNRLQALGVDSEQDVLIGIHSGARMPLKRWAPDRYAELISRILKTKLGKIVLLSVPELQNRTDEKTPIRVSNLSLRELAAVLSYCRVLVCNDSAPMHLAAAVGTNCVAIFGPSKSDETGPDYAKAYGSGHLVIEKPYSCRATCDEATCHYTIYQDCMKTISVDEVFESLEKIIKT